MGQRLKNEDFISAVKNWFDVNYPPMREMRNITRKLYNGEITKNRLIKDYIEIKNLINYIDKYKIVCREAITMLGHLGNILEIFCVEENFAYHLELNTINLLKNNVFINSLRNHRFTFIVIKLEESLYSLKEALKTYNYKYSKEAEDQLLNIGSLICLTFIMGM